MSDRDSQTDNNIGKYRQKSATCKQDDDAAPLAGQGFSNFALSSEVSHTGTKGDICVVCGALCAAAACVLLKEIIYFALEIAAAAVADAAATKATAAIGPGAALTALYYSPTRSKGTATTTLARCR